MILGVPQIVVNVADLDAQQSDLAEQGYMTTFVERDLANNDAKAAFQAEARSSLDMIHLTRPRSFPALELTQYDGGPPCGETAYRLDTDTLEQGVRVIEVLAHEFDGSVEFWRALGFRECFTADDGCRVFELPTLLPDWRILIKLKDQEVETSPTTTVDAEGIVLVTALTSDLDRDLARLSETASRVSPAWSEHVAGRLIRVAIIGGASGELVELLEAPEAAR